MSARNLESIKTREDGDRFDTLVPGLDAARRRRERRYKEAQVDPGDAQAVEDMMQLAEDESIEYGEE
jgi:hypothetical protein